ncbi:hydroxylamine reductase [Prochlorothrix hollandica]|uniref:Hydroxylamine reductase n=1 Tax=Prochlorothrix hollandica PCC 9006 = CALU 1027 TaxID=317619 RepID=A0A0M2PZW5_PROHO|nr:hydroxylamine reductase [Prochlorothrix hollandica]KKJ00239.1 hydroxylamine reductase [Prochlorothrix hollandica PCC 9006 = CALU 1027]
MFCEQCEQTASGQGCHQWGACGKGPEVNALQDLLVYVLRGLAPVVLKAEALGLPVREINAFTCEALFATMTNVNFDGDRFKTYIRQALDRRNSLQAAIASAGDTEPWPAIATYEPQWDESLSSQGQDASLLLLQEAEGNIDIFSLKLTTLYGLKGMVAYASHAWELGQWDDNLFHFTQEILSKLGDTHLEVGDWVALALAVGQWNFRAMELLDSGHTGTYGHPVPTPVPLTAQAGKAILVSGHDIKHLATLLEQTRDRGITVYTHGELLPAHGYPKLKADNPHLYGHYGTAWQNQVHDFAKFPGAIVVTTNCLMPPHGEYSPKLFTVGAVGYQGLQYLEGETPDFEPAIAKALELPGFAASDVETDQPPRSVLTGFAHQAVLGVADQVIEAVKSGKIRHFFLVGGCDGAKPGRTYYTEFVEKVPEDCIVLTLACGKFRFFDKNLGHIGELPRLMDVGQCNDAYSAIQIALGLATAFDIGVNELPLSMVLSWYEQKAVAVLLTLLHLGIKDIRLGPTLPAFLSPNVLAILSQTYQLKAITTPDADLAACLA